MFGIFLGWKQERIEKDKKDVYDNNVEDVDDHDENGDDDVIV